MPHMWMPVQPILNIHRPSLLRKLGISSHVAAFIMRRIFIYKCGEIGLTHLWLLSRITLAELIYQAFEFQQIRHAEERTILAYDDLRIGSNDIRPLRRNRADRDIIDPEQETSSVTVVALAHTSELLATERMERMRDPHKTHGCDRNICIRD